MVYFDNTDIANIFKNTEIAATLADAMNETCNNAIAQAEEINENRMKALEGQIENYKNKFDRLATLLDNYILYEKVFETLKNKLEAINIKVDTIDNGIEFRNWTITYGHAAYHAVAMPRGNNPLAWPIATFNVETTGNVDEDVNKIYAELTRMM